jgi:hypothetical protein
MKILSFFLFLLFLNPVFSKEINLRCMSTLKSYIDGRLDSTKEGVLKVNINEYEDKDVIILTDGLSFQGVGTVKHQGKHITNLSNQSQWNIINTYDKNENYLLQRDEIRIDKKTKKIEITEYYSPEPNSYHLNTVSGICNMDKLLKR